MVTWYRYFISNIPRDCELVRLTRSSFYSISKVSSNFCLKTVPFSLTIYIGKLLTIKNVHSIRPIIKTIECIQLRIILAIVMAPKI